VCRSCRTVTPTTPYVKGVKISQHCLWAAYLVYFDCRDPVARGSVHTSTALQTTVTKHLYCRPTLSVPIPCHVAAPAAFHPHSDPVHHQVPPSHNQTSVALQFPSPLSHTITQLLSPAHFNTEDKPVWPSHLLCIVNNDCPMIITRYTTYPFWDAIELPERMKDRQTHFVERQQYNCRLPHARCCNDVSCWYNMQYVLLTVHYSISVPWNQRDVIFIQFIKN
jgi:hypothetical protein